MQRPDSGFTLIEVLVAFAVAAMSLTLLLKIQSNSTATVHAAQQYLIAIELARSLIDDSSVTESSPRFERSGRFDHYEWIVQGNEYLSQKGDWRIPGSADSASNDAGDSVLPLREITASVTWFARDRTNRFDLRTVRPYRGGADDARAP
jgi:general secretion pathway protein I